MSKILIDDKSIAVPGETLAIGMEVLPGLGTYREGEKIVANRLGLASIEGRAVKLIPLSSLSSHPYDFPFLSFLLPLLQAAHS